MSQDLCEVRGTNLVVTLLVVLFAISSWVDINGMFVELPILTQKLPEGWNLPSYMAVTIQIANIAPFLYTVVRMACPRCSIEVPVIYTIICIGAVSCFLLLFFWDATAVIGGNVHSVGLLSLQFFLALVDCTSSVAYLPFMGAFKPQYMPAFYVGEGLSGLLPSLAALAQGAGKMRCVNETVMQNVTRPNGSLVVEQSFVVSPKYDPPKFSIEVFFGFLASMLVVSCVSFTLLNFWPYVQKEKEVVERSKEQPSAVSHENHIRFLPTSSPGETHSQQQVDVVNSQSLLLSLSTISSREGAEPADGTGAAGEDAIISASVQRKMLAKWQYVTLLLLTAWVNGLGNGVLPSVQTYSCLPYGIDAYHLAVTLSTIANPVACCCMFLVQARGLRSVSLLSVISSAMAAYVLFTAAASPSPPLSRHALGPTTVVTVWVLVVFFLTFTKISIASILREEGRRALLWCGAFTQVGSLVGALAAFIIINIYGVFQQTNICA